MFVDASFDTLVKFEAVGSIAIHESARPRAGKTLWQAPWGRRLHSRCATRAPLGDYQETCCQFTDTEVSRLRVILTEPNFGPHAHENLFTHVRMSFGKFSGLGLGPITSR